MLNTHATVRCLLIPSNGGQLLVPSAVVAEVSPYKQPEPLTKNQPNWLLGMINWRSQRVPLLSIQEALLLPSVAEVVTKYRTIILYGLESTSAMPFYAFQATDVPRPLTINEETFTHFSPEARTGLVFQVTIDDQNTAWLPDVVYLENLLIKSSLFSRPV